jgi:tripartite-type tricarboxylate transporter receptor subunit TctC
MLTRREIFHRASGAVAAASLSPATRADVAWPSQPIRIVIPFPPGGSSDILVRLVADRLTPVLKQPFIIDNRGGAGGTIGAEFVARAKPDGHTFLAAQVGTLAFAPWLYPDAQYDAVKSFKPVAHQSDVPNVLVVHPSLPVRTVAEFVAYAKANPGKLNYSSAGIGSAAHVSVAYFAYATGTDMVHIPYRGTGPGLVDLVAGRVQLTITGALAVMPYIKIGQLRALAMTSLKRAPFAPDLPTVAESGYPGFEAVQWNGIVAPAGTPDAIVDKFHDAVNALLATREFADKLNEQGAVPVIESAAQFGELIKNDLPKWGEVIRKANIKV